MEWLIIGGILGGFVVVMLVDLHRAWKAEGSDDDDGGIGLGEDASTPQTGSVLAERWPRRRAEFRGSADASALYVLRPRERRRELGLRCQIPRELLLVGGVDPFLASGDQIEAADRLRAHGQRCTPKGRA